VGVCVFVYVCVCGWEGRGGDRARQNISDGPPLSQNTLNL
jgi:hypothetical protein